MSSEAKSIQIKAAPAGAQDAPLIPEAYVDVPSQRLYVLSIGLLCQAIKIFDWLHSLVAERTSNLTLKWIIVDIAYCLILKRLRVPRLNYATAAVILQVLALCLFDGILFGTVQIGVSRYSLTSSAREFYRKELSTSGRMVNLRDLFLGDDHLKGEHTVRMSPISTAKLNPEGQSYCLGAPTSMVMIPILLNNTKPSHIRYTLSLPGSDRVESFELSAKELRSIEQQRLEAFQLMKSSSSQSEDSDVDWDDDDKESDTRRHIAIAHPSISQEIEKTQSVVYVKVTKPGIIRLDRVLDSTTPSLARIFSSETHVVPCPEAEFANDILSKGRGVLCAGTKEELTVKVTGVPPLSLRWHREVNNRREYFDVNRIEDTTSDEGRTRTIIVPLDMPLNVPGSHEYVLDSVIDGRGNLRTVTPANRKGLSQAVAAKSIRFVDVLRRSAVAFSRCAPGNPASLLLGSETLLTVAAKEFDQEDGPWDVTVKYQPGSADGSESKLSKAWEKKFTTTEAETQLTINANSPGEYSIVDVKGKHCPGDILSPETCKVVLQPNPTVEINWKRIHECSGDTGVYASLVLHGKPPFQVFYQQKRNNEPFKEMSRIFQGSRGEITLQPENSGNYTYTFVSLSDENYKRIKLDGPTINQIVHPLAAANFAGSTHGSATHRRSINSCSGNKVSVDIDLRGDGPWNLEVQSVGPKGSETLQFKDLRKKTETIEVPIPAVVDAEGGTFQIDLVSIQDSYGCKKELNVPGMSVNVRRVKPTARFYAKDNSREVTVLEDQDALLPMRLTGEGPWKITYQSNESTRKHTALLQNPNDHLVVKQKGIYHLVKVSDSQCIGEVIPEESSYVVSWIPHPVVKLASETKMKYEKYNGSFIRSPVCEGTRDYVDLDITGRAPFRVGYRVAEGDDTGGTKLIDTPVVSSVQNRARIELVTSQAGRIYYEIKYISDANYPMEQPIPVRERLLFEQEVFARPTAEFRKSSRIRHCLHDAFVPVDAYSMDDLIILSGRAPFHLELSVKNLATSEVYRQTIEIWETRWKVNLPNYFFSTVGPHLLSIESIRDASSCTQAAIDPLKKSIWVDVAESAAIVPFDHREHFCIGDITQFQLEGIPPWNIGYTSNKKQHEQVVKQSPFALVQQYPGEFAITSISHQQQMCKTFVNNIKFQIHALPSASVAEGKEYIEDIHEGSQAQIIFSLIGEPPFTFTYQRSELPVRKGARPGKVLETHTVSGVMTHEYSIYSALEGTWTVTFIADKFCRYPPAQPESLGEKNRN